MRTLTIFISLFFISYSFAQDLEKIKQADTIYIYFKEDGINQIYHIEKGKTKTYSNYFFNFSKKQLSFQFWNLQTLHSQTKLKRKTFIKKNKDIIINYDFVEKHGSLLVAEVIGYSIHSKKIIYVIENNPKKCSRKILKQVTIVGPVRFSEE